MTRTAADCVAQLSVAYVQRMLAEEGHVYQTDREPSKASPKTDPKPLNPKPDQVLSLFSDWGAFLESGLSGAVVKGATHLAWLRELPEYLQDMSSIKA